MRSLVAGLLLASLACQMPEEEYRAWLTAADSTLGVRQDSLQATFHIGSFSRFDYDEATGAFVFSDSGVARVIAQAEFVGFAARRDSTWTWSWQQPQFSPSLTRAARKARRYGWLHGVARLRSSGWRGDYVDGWEMTSLTCVISGCLGAYRAPASDSSGYTFLLFKTMAVARPGSAPSDYVTSPRAH